MIKVLQLLNRWLKKLSTLVFHLLMMENIYGLMMVNIIT